MKADINPLKKILQSSIRISYRLPSLKNNKALILAPHPDDETLGCGGAILSMLGQDKEVEIVLLTDGEKGGEIENLASVRLTEFKSATNILGCNKIHYLHFPDGQLSKCRLDTKVRLTEIITNTNPDIIFTPYVFDYNLDHLLTNLILAECVVSSSIVIAMYEIWTPILYPDCYLNISEVFSTKLAAIECYKSQEKYYRITEKTKALNLLRAELSMRKGVKYIEAFKCFSAEDYSQLVSILTCNDFCTKILD